MPILNFYMFVVGYSRTRLGNRLKLLLIPPNCKLDHLMNLGPDPKFIVRYAGYATDKGLDVVHWDKRVHHMTSEEILNWLRAERRSLKTWALEHSRQVYYRRIKQK